MVTSLAGSGASAVEITLGEVGVRLDAPVPQEGPVGPALVHLGEIDVGGEHFLAGTRAHEDAPAARLHRRPDCC